MLTHRATEMTFTSEELEVFVPEGKSDPVKYEPYGTTEKNFKIPRNVN